MANGIHRGQERFLPYLPQDNAGLADAQAELACQVINGQLVELLSQPTAVLWDTVANDDSLIICLDTYLRFARRPFDGHGALSSIIDRQLSQRIFAVYHCLLNTAGLNGTSQRSKMLYDRWILDVPKLLDLAAIYGPDNASLVQQLMQQAFRVQPQYGGDLWDIGPALSANLRDVQVSCQQASTRLKQTPSDNSTLSGLIDGIQYLRDTCITLCCFLQAYPSGAQVLMQGQAGMILQLTSLHDELLPTLSQAATSANNEPLAQQIAQLTCQLAPICQKLAELLISQGCLQQHPLPGLSNPPWAGKEVFTPSAQGEQLMAAVIAMAQPSQQLDAHQTLLKAEVNQFGLVLAAQEAIAKGTVQLDTDQQDYLGVLLGAPASFGSGYVPTGLQASSSNDAPGQQALQSYISQIKDVLPDFGDGFLAAALQHFSYNSEQVIHALLEGGLPPELQCLDPQAPLQPPSKQTASKGKAAARNSSTGGGPVPDARWSDLANAAAAADQPSSSSQANPRLTSQQPARRSAHKATSRALGSSSAADRAATLRFADAAQWEYEDEYDDSYDDLAPFGNDAAADVEGDDEAGTAHAGHLTHPQGAHPPGFPQPPGRPPAGQRQQQQQHPQQRQRQQSNAKPGKMWVLDGRIYNYKKEGATEVRNHGEAEQVLQAAAAAAQAIHGLGPGGNVPLAPQDTQGQAAGQRTEPAARDQRGPQYNDTRRHHNLTKEQLQHRRKDTNKAAVGNHHRKDRALRKMGGPAL